jgi:Phage Terminase
MKIARAGGVKLRAELSRNSTNVSTSTQPSTLRSAGLRWPGSCQYHETIEAGKRAQKGEAKCRASCKTAATTDATGKFAEELLNNDGLPVDYARQSYLSLSDPTKTLHEQIVGRKLRHAGHPILRWHASNAVARKDVAGNMKLEMDKSRKKIDRMAALVNAVAEAISHLPETPMVYEKREILWL